MNKRAKRIIGNISVGAFLAGVLGILAVNHFDPDFLKNDAELTAEANAGTPIVQGPIVPQTLPTARATTPAEIDSARQIALDLGRSEATCDKNCVSWNPSGAAGSPQGWADKVAASWLDSAGAGCPDAMTWPYYYIESFDSNAPGQLRITMEQAAAADPQIFTDTPGDLEFIAEEVLDATHKKFKDLESVHVVVDGHSAVSTVEVKDRREAAR